MRLGFTDPEVRSAYQAARNIPEVIENLPCYCGCFSNALVVAVTALLYAEMRSPVYLPGTMNVRIGFDSRLTSILLQLHSAGSIVLNMTGIPLLAAALYSIAVPRRPIADLT